MYRMHGHGPALSSTLVSDLGACTLTQLLQQIEGKITVIVGGGVRTSNIVQLKSMQVVKATWFHLSQSKDRGETADK